MNDMTRLEAEGAIPVADPVVDAPPAAKRRRWLGPLLTISVPLLLIVVGAYFYLTGGRTVSTDNAYVGAHVVAVAPEVSGKIVEVAVTENQRVKKGDLLYRIDPAPFRIALMQADAAVGNARLQISQMQAGYSSKVATIGEKSSDVLLAQQNYERQAELMKRGFTTRASLDAARAALDSARAQQSTASADARAAQALLGESMQGGHPQVEAALATRAKAELDLQRATLRAPMDGVISQSDKLNPGVMALQALSNVSIVGGGDYWIEANFKETQLPKVHAGQRATVSFDAIPGRSFAGHVIGIGSGTGSEFSVLPAQNATGNWVKVTQRVPVRVRLDQPTDRPLVAGWSAHVTIDVAG